MVDTQRSYLPKAVRRAARAAEREHQKIYSAESEQPVAEPQTAASVVALQTATQEPSSAAQTPPEPAQEAPSATPAPLQEPPAADPEDQAAGPPSEDWEQKYRTLQGIINRKNREIEGMQATLAAVAQARAGAPEPASAQNAPPASVQRRLKKEDIDSYGEDFINVMKAAAVDAATEEFLPRLTSLQEENARLKQQLGGVTQRTAVSEQQRVEQFLDTQVPNWRQINEDQRYIDWLQEVDLFTGVQRQLLLNNAGKERDGPRIAAFFTAYLNESQAIRGHQEAQRTAQPQAPAPQPVHVQARPTIDKTSLVAPGRPSTSGGNGAGAATDTEEPQFFTERQVSEFYAAVTAGKFKTNPKEKDRIEKMIHKAAVEGRINATPQTRFRNTLFQ